MIFFGGRLVVPMTLVWLVILVAIQVSVVQIGNPIPDVFWWVLLPMFIKDVFALNETMVVAHESR